VALERLGQALGLAPRSGRLRVHRQQLGFEQVDEAGGGGGGGELGGHAALRRRRGLLSLRPRGRPPDEAGPIGQPSTQSALPHVPPPAMVATGMATIAVPQ
jgi:hypothetical protein